MLKENPGTILIKTSFDNIIYELPTNDQTYLYVAKPNNEILVSTYLNLKKGTFIDVGAFIGKHTIRCAKNSYVKVIAIEPNPISNKILTKNIQLNNVEKNTCVVEAALVDDEKIDSINMLMDFDRSKITNKTENTNSLRAVRAVTFDSLIKQYNIDFNEDVLMKIDVEGFEYQLLNSMRNFLISSPKNFKIICEILQNNSKKIETISYLKSIGFNLFQIDNENYFIYKH